MRNTYGIAHLCTLILCEFKLPRYCQYRRFIYIQKLSFLYFFSRLDAASVKLGHFKIIYFINLFIFVRYTEKDTDFVVQNNNLKCQFYFLQTCYLFSANIFGRNVEEINVRILRSI